MAWLAVFLRHRIQHARRWKVLSSFFYGGDGFLLLSRIARSLVDTRHGLQASSLLLALGMSVCLAMEMLVVDEIYKERNWKTLVI